MTKFDNVTKENIKEHHTHSPQVPDHPYILLMIVGSGYAKTNLSFNLISLQLDINKI